VKYCACFDNIVFSLNFIVLMFVSRGVLFEPGITRVSSKINTIFCFVFSFPFLNFLFCFEHMCYSATRPKLLTSFVQVSQSYSEIVFEWAAASSMRIELQLIFDRKTTDSATDFYNKDIYTARNIKSKSEP